MTKAAKKQFRNDDIEKILPLKESIDSFEKSEKALHDMERENLADGAAIAEGCCNLLRYWGGKAPGMMELIAESEKTINTVYRVGIETNECWHKLASDLALVAREMIGCQSADEFYTLQRIFANQLSKRFLEETSRISCMLFGDFEGMGFCVLPPD